MNSPYDHDSIATVPPTANERNAVAEEVTVESIDQRAEPMASLLSVRHGPGSNDAAPVVSDYELLGLAGRGAYGSVWVARDRTGILRALKIVDLVGLRHPDPGRREAQALALVRQRVPCHPNLVEVIPVSQQHGRLVYAMELADPAPGSNPPEQGGYQADTLAGRIASSDRLPVAEAVRLALDLLTALEALHVAGLVHRDVKPSNVIFVNGAVKLADIGLAAVAHDDLSVAGTPGYFPLDGSTGHDADLYALGKLLYQAVTGLPPCDFPSVPIEVLRGSDARAFRRLNGVLLRTCALTKAERFGSANELRCALKRVLIPGPTPTQMRARFGWSVVLLGAVVCCLCLALLKQVPAEIPSPGREVVPQRQGVNEGIAGGIADPMDDAFLGHAAVSDADSVSVGSGQRERRQLGLDERLSGIIEDGRFIGAGYAPPIVADFSFLRPLTNWQALNGGSPVPLQYGKNTSSAPVCGLRLTAFAAAGDGISDLSLLQNMPWLRSIHGRNTARVLE